MPPPLTILGPTPSLAPGIAPLAGVKPTSPPPLGAFFGSPPPAGGRIPLHVEDYEMQ